MVVITPGKVTGIKEIVGFIIEQPGKMGLEKIDHQPEDQEQQKDGPGFHQSSVVSDQSSVISRQSSDFRLLITLPLKQVFH